VNAGGLVERVLGGDISDALKDARAVDVIAAGKASSVMLGAFAAAAPVPPRRMLAIGPRSPTTPSLPPGAEWCGAGHPLPDENSLAGARRALEIAGAGGAGDALIVLLSGGGSALMALPAPGLTLEAKQHTARRLMQQGADLYELNTVRKHLSAIKGGRLAAAAGGWVHTLAVSDVVGDDLSVIASGPTCADDTTFADALEVLSRRGGRSAYREEVVSHLRRGQAGEIPETPKTGDSRLARSVASVIGPQRGAIEGARRAAETLRYHVHVVDEPITGEARLAGRAHIDAVTRTLASLPRPLCVISSGETTVTVVGKGTGGRNQEFALAMAQSLEGVGPSVVAASIGTDGIDGPTDAAGALVDSTTLTRAQRSGIAPETYLAENNTYEFFHRLGDLIRTGPTSTNVGDLQVVLVGR
jgi:hydroxypyruvate reductase